MRYALARVKFANAGFDVSAHFELVAQNQVIRDITIGNYRAFYHIKRHAVEIISIHNCKQAILGLRSL